MEEKKIQPQDFIKSEVHYDNEYQKIFNEDNQIIVELRGWGAIQNLPAFKKNGNYDLEGAGKFQDKVGEFIAAAINEKLQSSHKEEVKELCDGLKEIMKIVLEYRKLNGVNGDNPCGNHCYNIANETLSKYKDNGK